MRLNEQYPILINNRDRLKPLLQMIHWLEKAGQTDIIVVDNDSTYSPLLSYYRRCPYRVARLGVNVGHTAPWTTGLVTRYAADRYYVVTDPDIVPAPTCPMDALDRFRQLLDMYPERDKVGFGLKVDDLPNHYRFADEVRAWESQFWTKELGPGVYDAPIDTSFALYRPNAQYSSERLPYSLRTGAPYLARHTPWYSNTRNPDREERYYRTHTRTDVNHWDGEQLPERLHHLLKTVGFEAKNPKPTHSLTWIARFAAKFTQRG